MEDKKDTVPKTDSSSEKHQESKKFLVFYVSGLFCVALALILLSYISQVRADRRLNELSSQLTTQTSAVEGANARLQVLQHSVEEQGRVLSEQQKTLDTLMKETGTETMEEMLAAVERLNQQKTVLYELTMAQQEIAQEKLPAAKARLESMVKTYTLEALNGTGKDALLKEEVAAVFTSLYNQIKVP